MGDAGPIVDAMAVMLENISTITVMSRTTISAVYRTAQIVAPIPNLLYQKKASHKIWLLLMFKFVSVGYSNTSLFLFFRHSLRLCFIT